MSIDSEMTEETAGVSSPTQLLGCPFCGSTAVVRFTNMIYCSDNVNCGAQIESGDSGDNTQKLTIAAWNKRAHH